MVRALLFVAALCTAASVAPAQSSSAAAPCDSTWRDPTNRVADTVFMTCAVTQPARLLNAPPPAFSFREQYPCALVELEFVVGASGRPLPGTVRVVRTNVDAFADAVVRGLERWRFDPARRGERRVAQLVRIRHRLSDTRASLTPPPISPGSRRLPDPTIACPAI